MSAKLITFYSFKGGVGRTQALANVAVGLANRGKNVVVVDMDLESPGLHAFFYPRVADRGPFRDEDFTAGMGLIDFVEQCARLPDEEPRVLDLLVPCAHPRHDAQGGWIRLLPAGRFNDEYPERIASFSWEAFYSQKHGYEFIELLRDRLIESGADYVLVDSRTGMTDVANICTFQLPDIVVVLFALHDQGLEGAYRVAQAIRRAQEQEGASARVRRVLLVPSRVEETGELELRNRWLAKVRDRLAGCGELLADHGQRLPYLPQIAYGEQIVVDPGEPDILSEAYERLIDSITRSTDRASHRPPPPITSFEDIRGDAQCMQESINTFVATLDTFVPAAKSMQEIQHWAQRILRQRDERIQEIRRLEEGLLSRGRELGVSPLAPLELEAERIETVSNWRELQVRLHQRTEDWITQFAAAKHSEIERLLLEAADQDPSLMQEVIAKLTPLIERGEFDTIDDQLPILLEELARQSLEALLARDALERERLTRSRPNPDEWLDERLDRVLAEGSKSTYVILRNLLRLRMETLTDPAPLHWSAYEVLCATSSSDHYESGRTFNTIGLPLWMLEWKRRFDITTGSALPPVLAGRAARENLERVLAHHPTHGDPLVRTIKDGLLRLWSNGRRRAALGIIVQWREDAGLRATLAQIGLSSESARIRREFLSTWLRNTAPGGYQPDILRGFLECLVEEGWDAEAFYLLEALHALRVSVAQARSMVDVAFMIRAMEAGRNGIAEVLLADKEIRESIATVAAGKALLVLLAWQTQRFPRFVSELRQLVVSSLEHHGPSLSPELSELVASPVSFNPAAARQAREFIRSIRGEYQSKRFFSNWDASRHYETDFHALIHDRLDELLRTTVPHDEEVERQRKLWDGEAWIEESYRAQRQKGLRTSVPDGSARRSIIQTFTAVRDRFLEVAALRPSSGYPSLQSMLEQESMFSAHLRTLFNWIENADLDGESTVTQRLGRRILALVDSVPSAGSHEDNERADLRFARFPIDPRLFEQNPLLFDLEDRGRTDPLRYLDTLLATVAGERGLAQAAQEYLERGDVLRAARTVQDIDIGGAPEPVCAAIDETWGRLREERQRRLHQIAESASVVRSAGIQWDSAGDLTAFIADAEQIFSQLPKGTGEPLRRELARLDSRIIAKLDDLLGYAALALEDGQTALQRYQQEHLGRIRDAKRAFDVRTDELLLQVDLGPDDGRALERLSSLAGDCLRRRDLEGLHRLHELLRRIETGDTPAVLAELGIESAAMAVPVKVPDARVPSRSGRERLTLRDLGGLTRKSIGAQPHDKTKQPPSTVPEIKRLAFSPLLWARDELLSHRDEALRIVRLAPDAPAADPAIGEYLMAEGKLRLLDDNPLQAASFFLDSYRWACTMQETSSEAPTHAASSLLLATLLAYLPPRQRRARLDPRDLTTTLQRGPLASVLPEMDQRSLLGEQARVAARMGTRDGSAYLDGYIVPYLEGHPRAAYSFVERAVVDLAEVLDGTGLLASLLHVVTFVLDRLVPDLRVGTEPGYRAMFDESAKIHDPQHRKELREILLRYRGLLLPRMDQHGLIALAAERLAAETERLGDPAGPPNRLTHSLLTPSITLGPASRVVLQLSLPYDTPLLRNIQTDVDLLDIEGRQLTGAFHPPAILARLGSKERCEVPLSFARFDIPQTATLRVRQQSVGLDGIARVIQVRAEQFSLTLESPPSRSLELLNPYVVGGAIQSTDRIYGREKDVDGVWRELAGERQDNVVLVTGERRIGKSTLLNAIAQDQRFRERYVIIKDDLQAFRHERSLTALFRSRILSRIRTSLKEAGIELPPVQEARFEESPGSAFEEFMRDVDRALEAMDRRLLLIFDELDQLLENESLGAHAIAVLRSVIIACRRTSFLFAGATEILNRHTATRDDRFFRLAVEVKLRPLDESSARRVVQDPVRGRYELVESATDLILRETNRQPYLLQYVASIIFQQAIDRGLRTITETDIVEVLDERVVPRTEVFYDFIASVPNAEDFVVVRALAALQMGNRYVSVTDLRRELDRMGKPMSEDELSERLRRLTESAPLVVERRLTTRAYRLQVGLFARHLRFISGLA